MALVDGSNEAIFDGAEGCRMGVFGKFTFGGVIAEKDVRFSWMGTC